MIEATYKVNLNPNLIAEAIKVAEEKLNYAVAPAKAVIVTDEPKNDYAD